MKAGVQYKIVIHDFANTKDHDFTVSIYTEKAEAEFYDSQ